jgi:hypothetical protein
VKTYEYRSRLNRFNDPVLDFNKKFEEIFSEFAKAEEDVAEIKIEWIGGGYVLVARGVPREEKIIIAGT